MEKYNRITYKKGSLLFNEGDLCKVAGFILSGEIKISTLNIDGKEYIINIIKENEWFADNLLFSKDNRYLGDVIATKDTTVLFYDKVQFLSYLKEDNNLDNYLTISSVKILDLRNKIKLLSQKNIRDRILFYLKENAIDKQVAIESKNYLANLLNIPRPSLSRELIKLKKEKVIDFNRKSITLMI